MCIGFVAPGHLAYLMVRRNLGVIEMWWEEQARHNGRRWRLGGAVVLGVIGTGMFVAGLLAFLQDLGKL